MAEILTDLTQVFRRVFRQPDLVIDANTTSADIPRWDSLTHMHLIAEIEKHFTIRLTFDEVSGLENVGDMIRIISRKRAGEK
jgi:acyl carrier protein